MSGAPVIAIDGPSGVGKGTLTARLARQLGFHVLDSGALYRIVAHAALARGVDAGDVDAVCALASALAIEFAIAEDGEHVGVRVDGQDVSLAIRNEAVGEAASRIAVLGPLRQALLDAQHRMRRAPGLVADGRDMGTVVFPTAELKVFLTASAQVRAERRLKQLKDKGVDANVRDLLEAIEARDARDSQRSVAPLRPAADAWLVDSTEMSADAVLACVLAEARRRGLCP